MIPYILTNNSLTAVIKGKSLTMEKDNPAFSEAVKLIHKAERGQEEQVEHDVPFLECSQGLQ